MVYILLPLEYARRIFKHWSVIPKTNCHCLSLFPVPATQVAVTGNVSATVNSSGESQIILQCSSNAGNPAPVLMWYKGSGIGKYIGSSALSANEIPDLYNGVRVTHTTVLKVNSTMDGCLITCCADFSNVCQSVRLDISCEFALKRCTWTWTTLTKFQSNKFEYWNRYWYRKYKSKLNVNKRALRHMKRVSCRKWYWIYSLAVLVYFIMSG